ncbi:hypothetical protein FGIG_00818 [Fasciola gigantica]|uniref:Uncharacterized protein n=1 Tax=Fasciola gigantica TaxID=46835 RepID=A0A504YG56_FASGI|nr:hypothetical protein FGIG_00818 [Fasciola gigantica]
MYMGNQYNKILMQSFERQAIESHSAEEGREKWNTTKRLEDASTSKTFKFVPVNHHYQAHLQPRVES